MADRECENPGCPQHGDPPTPFGTAMQKGVAREENMMTTDTFTHPARGQHFIAGEEVSENVYRRHEEVEGEMSAGDVLEFVAANYPCRCIGSSEACYHDLVGREASDG